jgi:hypothetical protein
MITEEFTVAGQCCGYKRNHFYYCTPEWSSERSKKSSAVTQIGLQIGQPRNWGLITGSSK